LLLPVPQSPPTGRRRRKLFGQITSASPAAQNPQNTFQHSAVAAGGRPPCGRFRRFGSKGRIFSHWASVNRRPYRAIGPPSALLSLLIAHFGRTNYSKITTLYPVLKQLLARNTVRFAQLTPFAERRRAVADPAGAYLLG
jgi:hypothetical protein